MKKQSQLQVTLASLIIGLSIQSVAHAQNSTPVPQSETFEAPITLTPVSTRPSSWAGTELALSGTDVVSYFQEDAPLAGSEQYAATWDDTTWHFSSEENRDLFTENPYKYVPAFGGYCPVALAQNHAKVGFSHQYTVVDEKLYLNYNAEALREFKETPKEYIVRAQLNF